ncbi:hypothetical protein OQA88_5891 [Cercophora sp. LCS_1]
MEFDGASSTEVDSITLQQWDEMEAVLFKNTEDCRIMEDAKFDARARAQIKRLDMDELDLQDKRAGLLEERFELLKKLQALDAQIENYGEKLGKLDENREALNQQIESERAQILSDRAKDDAEKRQAFQQYRQASALKLREREMLASRQTSVENAARAERVPQPEQRPHAEQLTAVHRAPSVERHRAVEQFRSEDPRPLEQPLRVQQSPHVEQARLVEQPRPIVKQTPLVQPTPPVRDASPVRQAPPAQPAPETQTVPQVQPAPDVQQLRARQASPIQQVPQVQESSQVEDVSPPEQPKTAGVENPPLDDEPMPDAPVADAPVVDAPVADAPVVDAPVADDSVPDAPMLDAPVVSQDNGAEEGEVDRGAAGSTLDAQSSSELTSQLSTPLSEPQLQFDHPPPENLEELTETEPAGPSTPKSNGIEVVDGFGDQIGQLRSIDLDNPRARYVLTLPIQRAVKSRPGKRMTLQTMASVYEAGDVKSAKWLSFHIQASGDLQDAPCYNCAMNNGPFNGCVLVGAPGFSKCANCEWGKKPCSLEDVTTSQEEATAGFKPFNAAPAVESGSESADADTKPKEEGRSRKALPDERKPNPDTPLAGTPIAGSPEPMPQEEGEDLPEINKEVLALQDDGEVYTDPPCMRGVPLAKISPDHPYWEKEWQSIEDFVLPNLRKWEDKYEHHKANGSSQSSKFLANRQVNRGKAILKFLEQGEFHPYQLIGKKYLTKTFLNYDTLFRMVQILDELGKFKIDITPSQWLRQRLHEVCEEQGDEFNLAKTVHDLYHDPKVISLRARSGFGNIGRPSGYRLEKEKETTAKTDKADKTTDSASKKASRSTKRKEPHITPRTTPKRIASAPKPQPAPVAQPEALTTRPRSSRGNLRREDAERQAALAPAVQSEIQASPTREPKKARMIQQAFSSEDIAYDGYTTHDSYSEDKVMKVDWRVHQVKYHEWSSNTKVTQYWHWVDKNTDGEGNMLEHQVLRDMVDQEVTWGVYKTPIDFHLRLPEIAEITYSVQSLKIIVNTKQIRGVEHRGEVLASFKRDRTKRRFLEFMSKRKGIRLIKTNASYIDAAWRNMQSNVLPTSDEEE